MVEVRRWKEAIVRRLRIDCIAGFPESGFATYKATVFSGGANCVSVMHNHVRCGFFALETCIGFWLDHTGQSTGFRQSIPDGIASEELMKFALVLSTLAIFTASVATVAAQSDMPAAPATTVAPDAQKGAKSYF